MQNLDEPKKTTNKNLTIKNVKHHEIITKRMNVNAEVETLTNMITNQQAADDDSARTKR